MIRWTDPNENVGVDSWPGIRWMWSTFLKILNKQSHSKMLDVCPLQAEEIGASDCVAIKRGCRDPRENLVSTQTFWISQLTILHAFRRFLLVCKTSNPILVFPSTYHSMISGFSLLQWKFQAVGEIKKNLTRQLMVTPESSFDIFIVILLTVK